MRGNGLVGIRRYYSSSHLGGFGKRFQSVHELHDREHRGHAERLEHQSRSFVCERPHRAEGERQRYDDHTQRDDTVDERAVESASVVLMSGVRTSARSSGMCPVVENLPGHDRIGGRGQDCGRSSQTRERAGLVPFGRAFQ